MKAYVDEAAQALRSILSDRPIAYHPLLARATGGVKAGVFLSQLLYWSDKGSNPDGWIYKTQAEIKEETALTRCEQESARKQLKDRGILFEDRRGIPAKMHYRINFKALTAAINDMRHSCMSETDILDGRKPTYCNVGNRQSINRDDQKSTSERTAGGDAAVISQDSKEIHRQPKAATGNRKKNGKRQRQTASPEALQFSDEVSSLLNVQFSKNDIINNADALQIALKSEGIEVKEYIDWWQEKKKHLDPNLGILTKIVSDYRLDDEWQEDFKQRIKTNSDENEKIDLLDRARVLYRKTKNEDIVTFLKEFSVSIKSLFDLRRYVTGLESELEKKKAG